MSRTRRIIDCHAHVIDPDRFALAPGGGYRPRPDEVGTAQDYRAELDRNGVWGAVLVQPSGYGLDNAALLDAIGRNPARMRGIAMLDLQTDPAALEQLAERGVVGVRFNLATYEPDAFHRPEIKPFLARIRALGWFAEVFGTDAQWAQAAPLLRAAEVKTLVDHFGVEDVAAGTDQPGFREILALGRDGLAVVKLSAPFRVSRRPGTYDDLAPYVGALLEAFEPDCRLWGSDWPFLGLPSRPNYGEQLAALARWLPDEDERDRVLWRNPARLFGFGDAS
jgi:predicted TIM-barrel fold metal-dependent hydrolase